MTDSRTDERYISFAVNASTGAYDLDLGPDHLTDHIRRTCNRTHLKKLVEIHHKKSLGTKENPAWGTIAGVDVTDLAQAGWGLIFANGDPQARSIESQLEPLLGLRQSQAGERFKVFKGEKGYQAGQSAEDFLEDRGVGSGPVDPEIGVPYYLLLIGNPQTIPFEFQYLLDIQFAVGRLYFEEVTDYHRYAQAVVAAETGLIRRKRRVCLFAPRNDDDPATALSLHHLAMPLQRKLAQVDGWQVEGFFKDAASKDNLGRLMGGDLAPALLFTAGHGTMFIPESPRLMTHQGALLCQDWPGPIKSQKRIPETHFFGGHDLDPSSDLRGMIAFFFSCFGAGCPAVDDFYFARDSQDGKSHLPEQFAPHDFLTELPKAMLRHRAGGALAVVAHVERAWRSSFHTKKVISRIGDFESLLVDVMQGLPLGAAMEHINGRYAELGARLSDRILRLDAGIETNQRQLVELWTAQNDVRNYIIVGDPAVRLPLASQDDRRLDPAAMARAPLPPSPPARGTTPINKPDANIEDADWQRTPPVIQRLLCQLLAENRRWKD